MDMEVVEEGSAVIAVPEGRVDGLNATAFGEALANAVGEACKLLVVDFSRLAYVSSAGLRVILTQAKAMSQRDGRLEICSAPENILEVLKISGFDQILAIHDTRAAALGGTG